MNKRIADKNMRDMKKTMGLKYKRLKPGDLMDTHEAKIKGTMVNKVSTASPLKKKLAVLI